MDKMNIFERALARRLAEMTPEQRAYREKYLELEKDNIFFETQVPLYHLHTGPTGEILRIKMYRMILNEPNEPVVRPDLLLYLGMWDYKFDGRFVQKNLKAMEEHEDYVFLVDTGRDLCIRRQDMAFILEGSLKAVAERGLDFKEDSSPEFTNSDIGKLAKTHGLW